MSRRAGLHLLDTKLLHGESETIFAVCLQNFVIPMLQRNECYGTGCSCVVLSKDTDLTMILTLGTVCAERE